MKSAAAESKLLKGGAFLLEEVPPGDVFSPEDFTEEHRMIGRTTEDFVNNEVVPRLDDIEKLDLGLIRELLRKCGELGLLGVEVPESFGGLGLDKASATIVSEKMARAGSFTVSHSADTGIGLLPIVYFGSDEQKQKYLPRMVEGEICSAYALTETGSGSDATAAKARAVLSPEGTHYILNGEKMFITNAGFADIFITFAKIDGEKLSAFIVEKEFPGVSTGAEEKKMGLHGSSTRVLILQDALVPAGNLLGEVGQGAKIAFNILNIGRFKLGAICVGACKNVLGEATGYANQRRQFGKPISSFGAIQHKLAEICLRAWAAESMVYRTLGMIDARLKDTDLTNGAQVLEAIEEYAVECSIIKVLGSEVLSYAVDEGVQIYGGYGFIRDYPMERHYRDARINRIFEGTNEINRLLIPGMLMKRAIKGQLPLLNAAQKLMGELLAPAPLEEDSGALLEAERRAVTAAKKISLLILGAAAQKFGTGLADEQEVLMSASNIIMDTYTMESALLRALKKAAAEGAEKTVLVLDITRTLINDAVGRIELEARQALAAISEGDTLRTHLAALRKLLRHTPLNTVAARRRIAQAVIRAEGYPL